VRHQRAKGARTWLEAALGRRIFSLVCPDTGQPLDCDVVDISCGAAPAGGGGGSRAPPPAPAAPFQPLGQG